MDCGLFRSIPVAGNKFHSANRKNGSTWCLSTLLKYTGEKFEVYALEQNVTGITSLCDQEHGWCLVEMAG